MEWKKLSSPLAAPLNGFAAHHKIKSKEKHSFNTKKFKESRIVEIKKIKDCEIYILQASRRASSRWDMELSEKKQQRLMED